MAGIRIYNESLFATVRPCFELPHYRQTGFIFGCQNAKFKDIIGTHRNTILFAFTPVPIYNGCHFPGDFRALGLIAFRTHITSLAGFTITSSKPMPTALP